MRGEASDERLANGMWAKTNEGVVDIRTVLPRDLLHGPYVTQIRYLHCCHSVKDPILIHTASIQ